MCGMVGMLCMGLCLKKSAFSLSPSSPLSERGEKKGEMRSHRVRGGAGQAIAGQCQDCTGNAEERQGGEGQDWHARLRVGQAKGGCARSERERGRSVVTGRGAARQGRTEVKRRPVRSGTKSSCRTRTCSRRWCSIARRTHRRRPRCRSRAGPFRVPRRISSSIARSTSIRRRATSIRSTTTPSVT